jgi:hypothetical protein
MITRIHKGIDLLFRNPFMFLKYLKKFFFQYAVFPFYKPPDKFVKNINGVSFEINFGDFPSTGY